MDESGKAPVQNRTSLLIAKRVVQVENGVLIGGQLAGWILRQQQERVTDEQQGDGARDISHGDLRKIAAILSANSTRAVRSLSDCCRVTGYSDVIPGQRSGPGKSANRK